MEYKKIALCGTAYFQALWQKKFHSKKATKNLNIQDKYNHYTPSRKTLSEGLVKNHMKICCYCYSFRSFSHQPLNLSDSKSPGLFSVLWPISKRSSFGWPLLVLLFPSPPVSLPVHWLLYWARQLQLVQSWSSLWRSIVFSILLRSLGCIFLICSTSRICSFWLLFCWS